MLLPEDNKHVRLGQVSMSGRDLCNLCQAPTKNYLPVSQSSKLGSSQLIPAAVRMHFFTFSTFPFFLSSVTTSAGLTTDTQKIKHTTHLKLIFAFYWGVEIIHIVEFQLKTVKIVAETRGKGKVDLPQGGGVQVQACWVSWRCSCPPFPSWWVEQHAVLGCVLPVLPEMSTGDTHLIMNQQRQTELIHTAQPIHTPRRQSGSHQALQ